MKYASLLITCILLSGCVSLQHDETDPPPTVVEIKPVDSWNAEQQREIMVGTWIGKAITDEGNTKHWLVERNPAGQFKVNFMIVQPDGTINESQEVGEWGIAGHVYFTITKGWIANNAFVPADSTKPYYYDAYEILELTRHKFIYKNVVTGNVYALEKVDHGYQFPEAL